MGRLFVVSGPSGAGKSTLCRRLFQLIPDLAYSVSYTTRPPRPGEEHGRDYFFVSQDRFQEMIQNYDFLEWAEVFGHLYGTGRQWVENRLTAGQDVLVDIDIAGARTIKTNFPSALFIFIVPPTFEELKSRLLLRRTETEEQMADRLKRAQEEVQTREMYDFLIVNQEIEQAAADLAVVIRADRLRMARTKNFWAEFLGASAT